MNVASLELCKELYELSGWEAVSDWWVPKETVVRADLEPVIRYFVDPERSSITEDSYGHHWPSLPAYALGYLMRKLPIQTQIARGENVSSARISNKYTDHRYMRTTAVTPEDAACKLLIELFKLGVLTREAGDAGTN